MASTRALYIRFVILINLVVMNKYNLLIWLAPEHCTLAISKDEPEDARNRVTKLPFNGYSDEFLDRLEPNGNIPADKDLRYGLHCCNEISTGQTLLECVNFHRFFFVSRQPSRLMYPESTPHLVCVIEQ
ncbi:Cyclin-dependent kinase 14 [Homalodisca vitripennis]|nr:Cyclin-dependent kinase 14 [Homalodisca vitripennis]